MPDYPTQILENFLKTDVFAASDEIVTRDGNTKNLKILLQIIDNTDLQMKLIQMSNGKYEKNSENANLLFFDYPDAYLKEIERLMFPSWYSASFMSECSNSSVWGHYAEGHRGLCLVFECKEEEIGRAHV